MTTADAWPDLRSRLRGFVVGYCLGDAAARRPSPEGRLRAGTSATLFLANIEGLIRALVREEAKGIGGAIPSCCWHATARWADRTELGDLPGVVEWREKSSDAPWPDGWLSSVRSLRGSRGMAPSVEAAFRLGQAGQTGHVILTASSGDLVLARTLPIALLVATSLWDPMEPAGALSPRMMERVLSNAVDVARYTHAPAAQLYAVSATYSAASALRGAPLVGRDHVELVTSAFAEAYPSSALAAMDPFFAAAPDTLASVNGLLAQLPDPDAQLALARIGEDRTALRTLARGTAGALMADQDTRRDAAELLASISAGGRPGPGALTMALVGAARGIEELPAGSVDELDVGHVADSLANDLATIAHVGPDPAIWWARYPGW